MGQAMLMFLAVWTILLVVNVAGNPHTSASLPNADNELSTGSGAESRRAQQTKTYVVGISLSHPISCHMNNLKNCNASLFGGNSRLPCDYCNQSLVALRVLGNYINTTSTIKTLNGDKANLQIEVRYDAGDINKMKDNYRNLSQWNQQSNVNPMIFLLGPCYDKWNDEAAVIANQSGMTMIFWAIDYPTYGTYPGSQTTQLGSAWKTGLRRRLEATKALEETTEIDDDGDDGGVCNPHKTDHCFMPPSPEANPEAFEGVTSVVIPAERDALLQSVEDGWTPHVTYHKSAPGEVTAADMAGISPPRSLQSTKVYGVSHPCTQKQYMLYSIALPCSTIGNDDDTLLLTPFATLDLMRVPILTQTFSVQAKRCLDGQICTGTATTYNMQILDKVLNTCVVGNTGCSISSFCSSSTDYCHTYQGMSFSWTQSSNNGGHRFSFASASTKDFIVRITSTTNVSANITVTYSYTPSSPCPPFFGCRPCFQYPGCPAATDYPWCDGSTQVVCSKEPDPEGVVWDRGLSNVFDINVPITRWARDGIMQVFSTGARKFTFVTMAQSITGEDPATRQCTALARFCAGINGTSVLSFNFQGTTSFMVDMRFLRAEESDAFVVCGGVSAFVTFIMGAKAFSLHLKALVLDRPVGYLLLNATKGFNSNWFMEAAAIRYNSSSFCDTFGSYSSMLQVAQADPQFTEGYASIQMLAVGSLIMNTIRSLPQANLTDQTLLRNHLRTATSKTFLGDMSFSSIGQRQATWTASRQYMPVPRNYPGSDAVIRYESANIKLRYHAIDPMATYIAPNWIEKELQVYPCRSGCKFIDKICTPCNEGTYRNYQDIDCRPCAPGFYADVRGLAVCRKCPSGADCGGETILPKDMYFAVTSPGNESVVYDKNITSNRDRHCVDPFRVLTQRVFQACRPTSICKGGTHTCVGSNVGLLCGQCVPGETYHGIWYGKRECHKCLSHHWVRFLAALLFMALLCVGVVLSRQAYKAAHEASDLGCSLLRTMIHYLHALGIVKEAVRLDVHTVVAIMTWPLDVLVRPQELIEIGCEHQQGCKEEIRDITRNSMVALPVGIAVILTAHFIEGVIGYSMVILRALARCCEAVSKGADQVQDQAQSAAIQFKKSASNLTSGNFKTDKAVSYVTDGTSFKTKATRNAGYLGLWRGKSSKNAKPSYDGETLGRTRGLDDGVKEDVSVASFTTTATSTKRKKKRGTESWSKVFGPGNSFVQMHEGFTAQEHLRTIAREFLICLLLIYPFIVRGLVKVLTCIEVDGISKSGSQGNVNHRKRMSIAPDVICHTIEHNELTGEAFAFQFIMGFGIPAFLALVMQALRMEIFDLEWRRITQILLDGYKPDKCIWEILLFMRTFFLIWASSMQELSARCLFMLSIMAVYMTLTIEIRPYEYRDREVLHYLDLFGMVSVSITIGAGMVCQFELDKELAQSWTFSQPIKNMAVILCITVNILTIMYGMAAFLFNKISLRLQAIIRSSELSVDRAAYYLHRFVQLTFRGMNQVGYFSRNGRHFIDVSKLDDSERRFLVLSLTETMSACFDSGSKIHTWLLETAIHEAFDRAIKARDAQLRAMYEAHGGRSFAMVHLFGVFKLCRVTLRPPDIQAEKKLSEEKMVQGEARRGVGVTVEELHNALSAVNVDVLERHPDIHKPRTKEIEEEAKVAKANEEEKHKHGHMLTWNPNASLSVFEDYAQTWGSLKIGHGYQERLPINPDDQFWHSSAGTFWNSLQPYHKEYTEALNVQDSEGNKLNSDDSVKKAIREEKLPLRCPWPGDVKENTDFVDHLKSSKHADFQRQLEESYAMMQEEIGTLRLMTLEEEEGMPGREFMTEKEHEGLFASPMFAKKGALLQQPGERVSRKEKAETAKMDHTVSNAMRRLPLGDQDEKKPGPSLVRGPSMEPVPEQGHIVSEMLRRGTPQHSSPPPLPPPASPPTDGHRGESETQI